MADGAREETPLLLTDRKRRGRCPVCGEPLSMRRFESGVALLRCTGSCGWWSESLADGDAVRPTRRPLLDSLRDRRDLPRLY